MLQYKPSFQCCGLKRFPTFYGKRLFSFTEKYRSADHLPMAGEREQSPSSDHRFPVLLLKQMPSPMEAHFSTKYRLLKPWESPHPISDFLAANADVIRVILCSGLTRVDADTIGKLPNLECVVATSTGVDLIDLAECRRRAIAVANVGHPFSEDVADYAVGLLLSLLRKISAADRYVRGAFWSVQGEFSLGSKLAGKRIGIIGLGSIGSEIAKRLEAFGCIISYTSRRTKPSVPYTYFSNVCELASQCDALILSCALNNETKHIVNKDVLEAIGRKGVIINVGRGLLIDEKELVRSLKEGEIAGAGLDVFENEPIVPEELFDMDNVVLSPHSSAETEQALIDVLEVTMGNLEAFFSNKPFAFSSVRVDGATTYLLLFSPVNCVIYIQFLRLSLMEIVSLQHSSEVYLSP